MNDQLLKPSDIAKLFNFDGVRRIDQLVQDGVLTPELVVERGKEVRRYPLVQTVQQYVDYLQEKANRKADGVDDPLTLEQMALADLRWKSARAGKAELELAELKGQMHRAEDVEAVVSDMIARIRSSILALPGRLAVDTAQILHDTAEFLCTHILDAFSFFLLIDHFLLPSVTAHRIYLVFRSY